jgi:hypothetical protein
MLCQSLYVNWLELLVLSRRADAEGICLDQTTHELDDFGD